MATSPWTFTPFPPLPPTLFPNIAIYNATSPSSNITYQITLSYPFEWGSSITPSITTTTPALTLYVTDGNALSMTAAENLKRRKPVDPVQPDALVVGIGYALSDSVYELTQRAIDFGAPIPPDPLVVGGADAFLDFIDGAVRPWVRGTVFPGVRFTRDALYGHSSGGLLVAYVISTRPEMFDTFIAASPSLALRGGAILEEVTRRLGDGMGIPGEVPEEGGGGNVTRPAVFIGYGGYEAFPTRRRTENETQFQGRKVWANLSKLANLTHDFYDRLVGSGRMRDVVLKEYDGQDHASVGGTALTDGISYFVDW